MAEVRIQFMFPGEGMIINGAVMGPDTPVLGDEELALLPSYAAQRKSVRGLRAEEEDDGDDVR